MILELRRKSDYDEEIVDETNRVLGILTTFIDGKKRFNPGNLSSYDLEEIARLVRRENCDGLCYVCGCRVIWGMPMCPEHNEEIL